VELKEAFAPFIPVEVLDLLKLLEIAEFVLEPPVPLPCQRESGRRNQKPASQGFVG
jgi:hypothetical protein